MQILAELQPGDVQSIAASFLMAIIMFMFALGFMADSGESSQQIAKKRRNKKPFLNIPDIKLPVYMVEEEIFVEPLPKTQKRTQPARKPSNIDSAKLAQFTQILNAIGFSATEAASKAKQLLKQNPNLTQEELLRKATQ